MSGQSPSLFRPFSLRARARYGERWVRSQGMWGMKVLMRPQINGAGQIFLQESVQ